MKEQKVIDGKCDQMILEMKQAIEEGWSVVILQSYAVSGLIAILEKDQG